MEKPLEKSRIFFYFIQKETAFVKFYYLRRSLMSNHTFSHQSHDFNVISLGGDSPRKVRVVFAKSIII